LILGLVTSAFFNQQLFQDSSKEELL